MASFLGSECNLFQVFSDIKSSPPLASLEANLAQPLALPYEKALVDSDFKASREVEKSAISDKKFLPSNSLKSAMGL